MVGAGCIIVVTLELCVGRRWLKEEPKLGQMRG